MKLSLALVSLGLCIAPAVAQTIAKVWPSPPRNGMKDWQNQVTITSEKETWDTSAVSDECYTFWHPYVPFCGFSGHSHWRIKGRFLWRRLMLNKRFLMSGASFSRMFLPISLWSWTGKLTYLSEGECQGASWTLKNGNHKFSRNFYAGGMKCLAWVCSRHVWGRALI